MVALVTVPVEEMILAPVTQELVTLNQRGKSLIVLPELAQSKFVYYIIFLISISNRSFMQGFELDLLVDFFFRFFALVVLFVVWNCFSSNKLNLLYFAE